MIPKTVIRERDLHKFDGLGHTQRDQKIRAGEYPPFAKIFEGGRAKMWFGDEIAAWQAWRRAVRDGTARKKSSWRDYLDTNATDPVKGR
jgi:hypothetical protein